MTAEGRDVKDGDDGDEDQRYRGAWVALFISVQQDAVVCLRGGQGPDRKWSGTTPSSALKQSGVSSQRGENALRGSMGAWFLSLAQMQTPPGMPKAPGRRHPRTIVSISGEGSDPQAMVTGTCRGHWVEDHAAKALDGAWRKKKIGNFLASMSFDQGVGSKGGVCPHRSNAIGPDRPRSSTRPLPLLPLGVTIPKVPRGCVTFKRVHPANSTRRLKMSGSRPRCIIRWHLVFSRRGLTARRSTVLTCGVGTGMSEF